MHTQASFTTEESAVALLFALIASGQIQLRRIDGYQHLVHHQYPSAPEIKDLRTVHASANERISRLRSQS